MSRPLRIEFAGALYHITSRGNEKKPIFWEEDDFEIFLAVFDEVCNRFNWVIHAWCLMTNHYHLLVETPDANLTAGMRQLNGVYTIKFNKKHRRVGHLFQGRYKGIQVDKSTYLLELSRYIVLNPVHARMVNDPDEWPWSSYLYTLGELPPPSWLAVDPLLRQLSDCRNKACQRYRNFVREGVEGKGVCPWDNLQNQVYLGSDHFVSELQKNLNANDNKLSEIPHKQKRTQKNLY